MLKTIITGYSGHAFVVAEAALSSGIRIKYYSEKEKATLNPYDLEYLGYDGDDNFKGWNGVYQFILGVGDNFTRQKIAERIWKFNKKILTIIHPSSSIAKNTEIGEGIFVARNSSINPLAVIGNFSIINTSCVIEHECIIGKAVHIAPGAILAGNVKVGDRSLIGANAVVKQGVTIGEDVLIGAGAVVIRDILNGEKVVGNPGRNLL